MVQWLARFVDDEKTFVQFKLRLIINLLYYYKYIICYFIAVSIEAIQLYCKHISSKLTGKLHALGVCFVGSSPACWTIRSYIGT